jgi:hypothetical protein
MMEAVRTSEELVNLYQSARRYDTEDGHLRSHCWEHLMSYVPEGRTASIVGVKVRRMHQFGTDGQSVSQSVLVSSPF